MKLFLKSIWIIISKAQKAQKAKMATYEKFNNEKYNIIYKTDKSKMHEWEAYLKTTMNDATNGIKLKAQLKKVRCLKKESKI